MSYAPIYNKPYPEGWVDGYGFTEVKANFLNMLDSTIEKIEAYLNSGMSADFALLTEAGYSLKMSMDKYFVMSISLLDKNGDILSTQSFDFPIESTVMDAKYADGVLTLILQNGNETPIDVSALIKGLVNETRTIAGIDLSDDITAEELRDALNVREHVEDITTTADTSMPNSHKGRLMFEEIGGVSEQGSTTGAQLLDLRDGVSNTINGVTLKNRGDGSYARTGTVVDTSNVVLNIWFKGNFNVTPLDDDSNVIVTLEAGKQYTVTDCVLFGYEGEVYQTYGQGNATSFTPSKTYKVTGVRNASVASGITYNDIIYPMLCEGELLPWEPYTGGQTSPNPSYPQEIKSVVVSGVKTHGKNFLKNTATTQTINGGTVTVNEDGSIIINGTFTALSYVDLCTDFDSTALAGMLFNGMHDVADSGGETNITVRISSSSSRVALQNIYANDSKIVDNGKNLTIAIRIPTGYTASNIVLKPMIRKADIANDTYEPYTESSIILSEPIELCGIGDVQDVIVQKDGVVRRRTKKVVFDGLDDSIEWWVASSQIVGRFICGILDAIGNRTALCTQAKTGSSTDVNMCYIDSNKNFYINTSFATLEEWKSHLQASPMTVIYELATEEVTALPTADKIALNSLLTYDGATYLEWDCYLEPTHKGEYGTSEVGGYTLEGLLTGRNAELLQQSNADRITALETALINNV